MVVRPTRQILSGISSVKRNRQRAGGLVAIARGLQLNEKSMRLNVFTLSLDNDLPSLWSSQGVVRRATK